MDWEAVFPYGVVRKDHPDGAVAFWMDFPDGYGLRKKRLFAMDSAVSILLACIDERGQCAAGSPTANRTPK